MNNKTILITRHDKIGDFITTLPMAKVLKEQTNYKIVFLLSSVNIPLAKNIPYIDDVIEYSTNITTLLQRINKHKPIISISGYIDFRLGLCLFLARIKTRIAPATKLAQIFFNTKLKQRRSKVEKTEWEYNLDLIKKLNMPINITYTPPCLSKFTTKSKASFIIFHTGFGGSSEGNLNIDDYIKLAKVAIKKTNVVFTFGPDDAKIKRQITKKIQQEKLNIEIKDNFKDIWEFTKYIAQSKLFVSTSTGPMHLAGLTNTPTLSFFGNSLFASSKRWATISETNKQNNFEVPTNYDNSFYKIIESKLLKLI